MKNSAWDRALLDALWREAVNGSFRMLILRDLALIAEEDGSAPISTLAQRFRNFFRKRQQEGKGESSGGEAVSERSLEWWEEEIRRRAALEAGELVVSDGQSVSFKKELWSQWSPGFRKALRNVAEARLIEYFETEGHGGW